MANLMFKLSRAVAAGRADKGVPQNSAPRSSSLCCASAPKRIARGSATRKKLRDQIKWALPVEEPADAG